MCGKCSCQMVLKQEKDPRAWSDHFPSMALGNFQPYRMVYKCPNHDTVTVVTLKGLEEQPRKRIKVTCSDCDGSGFVECSTCEGDGEVEKWEDEAD